MGDTTNYDRDIFDKILLKIKTLLDQGKLVTLPKIELEGHNARYMEFCNDAVMVTIKMFTNALNGEIWEIDIIDSHDGKLRCRCRSNVDGNAIACDIYRLYKKDIENPKLGIDEYVDTLFE